MLVFAQGQWASRNESQAWDEGFALVSGYAQVELDRLTDGLLAALLY